MQKTFIKPEMKGFELSQDYELLFKLIHEGYRVPAWIVYTDRFGKDNTIYDLVEVKLAYESERYSIGVRGSCYSGIDNKTIKGFVATCKFYDLKFIKPNV